ncbi:hypothetical protein [Streptomyces chrestomyceticus]|uniref:hypothetical protein n=1 Tax=Streptomyces chrestomyceticus TaxID=68185 RepID=UPI0035A916C0
MMRNVLYAWLQGTALLRTAGVDAATRPTGSEPPTVPIQRGMLPATRHDVSRSPARRRTTRAFVRRTPRRPASGATRRGLRPAWRRGGTDRGCGWPS